MAFMEGTRDDAANIEAIDRYMAGQQPKTDAAKKIKDEWRKWMDQLGWYDRNFPSLAVYDYARNIRNRYNTANAVTQAEQNAVKAVQEHGQSSEQSRGEADRRLSAGKSAGSYIEHPDEAPPEPPLIPTKYKVLVVAGAVGYFALTTLKKIYLDPILRVAARR